MRAMPHKYCFCPIESSLFLRCGFVFTKVGKLIGFPKRVGISELSSVVSVLFELTVCLDEFDETRCSCTAALRTWSAIYK